MVVPACARETPQVMPRFHPDAKARAHGHATQAPDAGQEEWVALPGLGLPALKAKVDTGARTSALHAFYLEPFGPAPRPTLHFAVHPVQGHTDLTIARSGSRDGGADRDHADGPHQHGLSHAERAAGDPARLADQPRRQFLSGTVAPRHLPQRRGQGALPLPAACASRS
jgi:hypothetical protein